MFQYNGTGACDHGLIINNITSTAKCKDNTRHYLEGDGKGGTWATWALDNQRYNLQMREPINWMTQLGTHESYNNKNDLLYFYPNQSVTLDNYRQNFPDIFETRVYGEAAAAHGDWPGYIYAHESDIPTSDNDRSYIDAPRPYGSQATSIDALLGCNVPLIDLDFFMSDEFYNGNGHPLDNQSDGREAFVWIWSKNDYGQPHTAALLKTRTGDFTRKTPRPCTTPPAPLRRSRGAACFARATRTTGKPLRA